MSVTLIDTTVVMLVQQFPTSATWTEMTAGTFPKLSSTHPPPSLMRATTAEATASGMLSELTFMACFTLNRPGQKIDINTSFSHLT
jgi:hypothetical protein